VAQVDREDNPPGNDVARIGPDVDRSDGGAAVGLMCLCDAVELDRDLRRREQRVAPQPQRCRPRVRILPRASTSNQRSPRAPVTTPMTLLVSSSTGPCSMCGSK
jgi:hypothetical protein